MSPLFTPYNAELAALVCGDPNTIHYRNAPGGTQIVCGLQQLVLAMDLVRAERGKTIELRFKRPIYASDQVDFFREGPSFCFRNARRVLTEGTIRQTPSPPKAKRSPAKTVLYRLTDTSTAAPEQHSCQNSSTIQRGLMQQILPHSARTDFSIAVLRSINPFIRTLSDDRTMLPEVSFPVVREAGSLAVLETGITIDLLGNCTEKMELFSVKGYTPQSVRPEKDALYCAEVAGLYRICISLSFLPKDKHRRYLQAMKGRTRGADGKQ